ncbi:hypothetical protein P8452_11592 [Trifolium repens]|nr:hypothetical protein P8452_11592 [Trifolium repens]
MDTKKCATLFFVFLVFLSVAFMSQASVAPPKPPNADHHLPSAKHGIALEPAMSEYGSGDRDGAYEAIVYPPSLN